MGWKGNGLNKSITGKRMGMMAVWTCGDKDIFVLLFLKLRMLQHAFILVDITQ